MVLPVAMMTKSGDSPLPMIDRPLVEDQRMTVVGVWDRTHSGLAESALQGPNCRSSTSFRFSPSLSLFLSASDPNLLRLAADAVSPV